MAIKIFGKTIVGGEAQRKEATANEMSGKYPLTNDCDLMKSTIEAAKAELAQINASRPSTAGGKRIKSRQLDSLRSWINEMQNFLKDLTCGIVYTPQGIVITPVAAQEKKTAVEPNQLTEQIVTRGDLAEKYARIAPPPPIVYTKEVVKDYIQPSPAPPIRMPIDPYPGPKLGYTPGKPIGEEIEEYVEPKIKCADGTFDVANGVNPPCATKGGIYTPSLPLPAPAPTLPSGQSTVVSSPLPATATPVSSTYVAPPVNYANLYDTAALGTQIAQTQAQPQPAKDDTQKYLMYGGIALVGVVVLNSLLNRD